jgi:hypothetical protein
MIGRGSEKPSFLEKKLSSGKLCLGHYKRHLYRMTGLTDPSGTGK